MSKQKKIAIIGGGAAGIFAAIRLGEMGFKNVQIFERSTEVLKKVKISGGGRCNVTHQFVSNAQFSKNYPRGQKILKSNFDKFSAKNMFEWLELKGVKLKIEEDGRVFPVSDDSQTIIDCFLKELKRFQIPIHFNSEIERIDKVEHQFQLNFKSKSENTDFLILATGGAQKERELDLVKNLKIETISPVPSLFTFKIHDPNLTELMGLSIPNVSVKIAGTEYRELGIVLVTHWGLSGPGILKLSAWAAFELNKKNYQFQILINWAGDDKEQVVLEAIESLIFKHGQALVKNYKLEKFPQRFWEYLLVKSEIDLSKKWSDLSKKNINKLIQTITHSVYDINGKTTYKEEFVTAGGIHTDALNSKTMEVINIPNLYCIGEVTNMDGITGGFNFQNCWTSADVCAQAIAEKLT